MFGLGHWNSRKSSIVIGSVLTVKVTRRARVSNVTSPMVPVGTSCSLLGSLLPLGVTQPTVAVTVAPGIAAMAAMIRDNTPVSPSRFTYSLFP